MYVHCGTCIRTVPVYVATVLWVHVLILYVEYNSWPHILYNMTCGTHIYCTHVCTTHVVHYLYHIRKKVFKVHTTMYNVHVMLKLQFYNFFVVF